MLPICVRPFDDEFLYGWLMRMAECNGVSGICKFQSDFLSSRKETSKKVPVGTVRLDYIRGLDHVCKENGATTSFPDVDFVFRRMSVLYALFPFDSYGKQAMRSQVILRDADNILYDIPLNSEVSEIKLCPQCMEEDKLNHGFFYCHTWHQMPETRMCARHGVVLQAAQRKHKLADVDLKQVVPVQLLADPETEWELSKFTKALYDKPLFIDLKSVRTILQRRMENLGYSGESPYDELAKGLRQSGYAVFFQEQTGRGIRRMLASPWIHKENLLRALSFLFPEPEVFVREAETAGEGFRDDFYQYIKENFHLLSPFGQTVFMECKICGNQFHIHPYAIMSGCGCPECDGRLSLEEIVNRQLSHLGDGEYELEGRFCGYGNRQSKIRHKTCGVVRKIRPADAVWCRRECGCTMEADLSRKQEKVDRYSRNFKVIGYESKKWGNGKVMILHEECGQTFATDLVNFLKFPYCRKCRQRNLSPQLFEKRVKDLVGDEYVVKTPFVNQDTKITFWHKTCGTCTDILPVEFQNGKRCDLCSTVIRQEELQQLVLECTGGKYHVAPKEISRYEIQGLDGTTMVKDSRFLIQELSRPTPSMVFRHRIKKPERAIGKKAEVYLWAKEKGRQFSCMEVKQELQMGDTQVHNILSWLKKNGYIRRVRYGLYEVSYRDIDL